MGEAAAAEYFALISHEPGHTIHMHVRFACPDAHRRCIGYAQAGSEEVNKVSKLPPSVLGKPIGKPTGKPGKLPVLQPKSPPRPSTAPKSKPPSKLPPRRSG